MIFLKSIGYSCLMLLFLTITTAHAAISTQNLSVHGANHLSATVQAAKSQIYTVKGKTYKTLSRESSKQYSVTGIASFYSSKLNGRITSNGEIYNENLLTAAHKRLPIPSYVLVTNIKNGRRVVVRVNDRGPFVGNRKIDLSKAAAKELGMLAKGIVQVKIEVVHVDKNGKISGPGGEKLTQLAKNKHLSQQHTTQKPVAHLVAAGSKQLPDTRTDMLTSKGNHASNENTGMLYELYSLNLSNDAKANALITQLSMSNINSEIIKDGRHVKVKFGPMNSHEMLNQLKAKLVQNGQYDNIVYSYQDNN